MGKKERVGQKAVIDFVRFRWLIRKAGDAYMRWQQAQADACCIGSPKWSDMPHAHDVGDPVGRSVLKVENVYQAYQQVLQQLQVMRKQVEPLIDSLADPDDKAVMRLRYMQGFSPEIIADSGLFHLSRTAVYNHLYHAEQIINCRQMQNG